MRRNGEARESEGGCGLREWRESGIVGEVEGGVSEKVRLKQSLKAHASTSRTDFRCEKHQRFGGRGSI